MSVKGFSVNGQIEKYDYPALDNLPHDIASDFSSLSAYKIGDYVVHDGKLYRFTANHAAGEWTGTDAVIAQIGEDLVGVKEDVSQIDADLDDTKNKVNSFNSNVILAQDSQPSSEYNKVWFDTDAADEYVLPQIKDAEISVSDTWSSQKIDAITGELKSDLSNLNLEYYFRDELLNNANGLTKETAISKPSIGKISVIVENTYNGDNYCRIEQYNSSGGQLSAYQVLMSANQTLTIDDFEIKSTTAKIVIKNLTGANGVKYTIYHTILSAVEETVETVNSDVFIEMPSVYKGYLDSNGSGVSAPSSSNRYTQFLPATVGEKFIYSGAYPGWGLVFGYYADNTAVSLLSAGTYEDKVLTIADSNIVKVRAWSDTSRTPLKFYSLKSIEAQLEQIEKSIPSDYGRIVVDASGNGDFTDLASAITYAKSAYNVSSYPVEIYIKDGIYQVSPTTTDPYYAVDKGANKINIRGQSRDGTIIRCTCTDELQGIALNIGGECTVENLTIENLADASFTSETILTGNHRPYCIHSDTPFGGNTRHYFTTIRNVKLYSECYCPLGAGLQDLQTLRLENVEAVYASNAVMLDQGAIYIHAPYSSSFVADGVQLVDCVMISENERPALVLPDVSGSQSMADVEQTFVRNVTASMGAIEVSLSAPNNKSFWSKSNSNPALNA